MKGETITVLVIGVGSHVSQGILKALAKSSLNCRVIGSCVSSQSEFLYFVDQARLQPLLEDGPERFKQWLLEVCREEGVQVILSGIEPVVRFLAEHKAEIERECSALAITPAVEILKVGQSKLETCRWLESKGFSCPKFSTWTSREDWEAFADEVGFPVVAKPIIGKGSQGIYLLEGADGLDQVEDKGAYIFQEHVGDKASEYTVGCFRSPNTGSVDCIVMKRDLTQGFTRRAEIVEDDLIASECVRIVEALEMKGSCNIQLRMHKGQPCVFEINARFSGTTPIRAHYGFNDVEASIRHFLLGESDRLPKVMSGMALRYWNEAYIDPQAKDQLQAEGILERDAGSGMETDTFGMQ